MTAIVRGLALAVSAAPSIVLACGACIEDKVASTYDHTVVTAAVARHQQILFVAVDGPIDAARVIKRIETAVPRVSGALTGTLRTSVSPPAFSFALDDSRSPAAVLSRIRREVDDPALRTSIVRIMRNGVLHEP